MPIAQLLAYNSVNYGGLHCQTKKWIRFEKKNLKIEKIWPSHGTIIQRTSNFQETKALTMEKFATENRKPKFWITVGFYQSLKSFYVDFRF